MEHDLMMIISLLFCCCDVLMLCIFFDSMFIRRIQGIRFWCCYGTMALIMFLFNSYGSSGLNFLMLPFFACLFSLLVFRLSVHKGIIYTLIFYIVFCCGREMAFEMLFRLMSEVFPGWNVDLHSLKGTGFLLMEYILSFLFLLYVRKHTAKIKIGEDSLLDWYLLIMPTASVMILFSFVFIDFPNDRYIQILMCGGAFLLYFSNAAVFVILAHFTQVMNQTRVTEMSLLKRDMERDNFKSIEKANEVYRKYMHDIHQYLYQIKRLSLTGENESIINIIDGWEGGLKNAEESSLYTDSPVLNSILTEYVSRAREQKAVVDVFVEECIGVGFIQDADKISMFGNLLENAVEAVCRCREDNRKIKIRLYMGSRHILVFQIKNTWLRKLKREEGHLLSVKKDAENHGLGVGIVRDLAEKYGGVLELEDEGEWFAATLMVSRYINK